MLSGFYLYLCANVSGQPIGPTFKGQLVPLPLKVGSKRRQISTNKRCVIYQKNEEDLIYTKTLACNHTKYRYVGSVEFN